MSNQQGKDVIYVDIDEEITSIIDKVRSSQQRIVALVLPKRAAVFQSIVNMKLLKRTSEDAKKHIVLITGEPGILPLAGNVGLYVAKNLQTKPEIPAGPSRPNDDAEEADESSQFEVHDNSGVVAADPSKSAGDQTAKTPIAAAAGYGMSDEDTIELDNEADMPGEEDAAQVIDTNAKDDKTKKDKRLKIPNFNRFRLILVLGGVGVLGLVLLLFFMFSVMPKATISIKTDSSKVNNNLDLTLSTVAKEFDAQQGIVPAVSQQIQKTSTQQVEATGQLDKGEKAGGSIMVINCSDKDATIPAGTGFSAAGKTYISQETAIVPASNFFSQANGGKCKNDGKRNVAVVAQKPGEAYNIEAQAYTIANGAATLAANGTAMTGGTSQIVKVVQQADIEAAKQKIATGDTNTVKQDLKDKLLDKDLYAITATLTTTNPEVQASASVGEEVANVTVTQKTTYTMLGAKETDLKKVIADAVNKKIDKNKQQILDYGLTQGVFAKQNDSAGGMLVALQITSIVGSDLDTANIKTQVAGKKAGQAQDIIKQYPGVTDVEVKYSPFWVSSIPKKTGKISIHIEEPTKSE